MPGVLVIAGLLASAAVPAYAMRCGVGLVDVGQYQYEVLDRCGAPIDQYVKTVYRPINYRDVYGYGDRRGYRYHYADNLSPLVVPVVVEVWIYDWGPHRLRRRLSFEDGQLVEIEVLDRGSVTSPQ
jgi:Protein of unknown function (DUF2845)